MIKWNVTPMTLYIFGAILYVLWKELSFRIEKWLRENKYELIKLLIKAIKSILGEKETFKNDRPKNKNKK